VTVFYSFRYVVKKKKVAGFQDAKTYAREVIYCIYKQTAVLLKFYMIKVLPNERTAIWNFLGQ
jgi:hypothetical protein